MPFSWFSSLFLLTLLESTEPFFYYTLKGCLSISADIIITVNYEDVLNAPKTAEYGVGENAIATATCSTRLFTKPKATLEINFGSDLLRLKFEAPAVYGKIVSIMSVEYTYTKDSDRFPGTIVETSHTTEKQFSSGEMTVGLWKQPFRCDSYTMAFGNVVVELRNLQLSTFISESRGEEVWCERTSDEAT